MKGSKFRQRYFVLVSVLYMLVGLVIIARSVMARVVPIAILGLVFLALGAVRLRDFYLSGNRVR